MSKLQKETARKLMTTHGKSYSPEYSSWSNMKQRCNNPNATGYKNYGGSGIKHCKRWDKFENFFHDMGKKPTKKHTIGRIDSSTNYTPENCRWETRKQQNRNHCRNNNITHNGKTMCLTDWAKESGIPYETLRGRVNKLEWPFDKAISIPVGKYPPIANKPAKERW